MIASYRRKTSNSGGLRWNSIWDRDNKLDRNNLNNLAMNISLVESTINDTSFEKYHKNK